MKMKKFLKFVLASIVATGFATSVSAATVSIGFDDLEGGDSTYDEDGYHFVPVSYQNGWCGIASPCTKETANSTVITTMTKIDGGSFDLLSFYFAFQGGGGGNTLKVFNTDDQTKYFEYVIGSPDPYNNLYLFPSDADQTGNVDHNIQYVAKFSVGDFGANVKSISWTSIDSANVRIDDIGVSAVPLPAGAVLMLTALGGLGMARRRKA